MRSAVFLAAPPPAAAARTTGIARFHAATVGLSTVYPAKQPQRSRYAVPPAMRTPIAAAFAAGLLATPASAHHLTLLYKFTGGTDGANPYAGLVADPDGKLYGATEGGGGGPCTAYPMVSGCGTIFSLTPPSQGATAWTETIIYTFATAKDGANPVGTLLRDGSGNLFGTTLFGGADGRKSPCSGGCGTVFELRPPTGGKTAWRRTTLYTFRGNNDGAFPQSKLIQDENGALYGTASGQLNCVNTCGEAYQLVPPPGGTGAWTKNTLHLFTAGDDGLAPIAGLLPGAKGVLFGVTASGGQTGSCTASDGCGTIFELSPPKKGGTLWRESILLKFDGTTKGAYPGADLTTDAAGNLYGATATLGAQDGGAAFMATRPVNGGSGWTFSVLHNFGGAKDGRETFAALLPGPGGTLLGVSSEGASPRSGGLAFRLTPPGAGGKSWTETRLANFSGAAFTEMPYATLLPAAQGAYYGTTFGLGTGPDFGAVYEISK